jgi:hypothetical protein
LFNDLKTYNEKLVITQCNELNMSKESSVKYLVVANRDFRATVGKHTAEDSSCIPEQLRSMSAVHAYNTRNWVNPFRLSVRGSSAPTLMY